MNLLETKGLGKCFGKGEGALWAVREVDFCIKASQSVAVTGPSGCGKTTLLNLLGLTLSPNEGSIAINGLDRQHLKENARAALRNKFFGYIVQDFALIEEDSVLKNIEIPLLYADKRMNRKDRRERAIQLAEQMDIADKINEKAKHLSGGQRQRVAIARALSNNPKVLLADEPTGSLDTKTGEDIMTILEAQVQSGAALVLITHNLDLARRCMRKISMQDGRIIQEE